MLWVKGEHVSLETEFKKGCTPWNKGKKLEPFSKKHREKLKGHHPKTEFKKGNISWNKNKIKETDERLKKMGENRKGKLHSEETKRKLKSYKREKHSNWKGGKECYYYQQAKIIWQEKHGRIEPKVGLIYLLEGMHILIGTRKMPVHHRDFNNRNNASWNLGLQQTMGIHKKIHIQYNEFLRFEEQLEKGEISFEEAMKYLS